MKGFVCAAAILLAAGSAFAQGLATIDGITFANTGKKLYVPVREVANNLGMPVAKGAKGFVLNGKPIPSDKTRWLNVGATLVEVAWLPKAGAIVNPGSSNRVTIKNAKQTGKAFYLRRGSKRIFINKKQQMLVAYQGQRTVFRSHVSTGKKGKETPTGLFKAKYKEKIHKSRLYNNVPMPWSIHIVGNIFVHGFHETPKYGSNGCIRLPIEGKNPARWLYYWTDIGTPVSVLGKWPKGAK